MQPLNTYSFDSLDAQQYGVFEAIFLYNLKFWVKTNLANNRNVFEVNVELYPQLKGQVRAWTYNSVEAFVDIFPFWTKKQIRTIVDSLLKQGVIIKGNYNKSQYDRTNWYALSDESIFQNCQKDLPKKANGFAKKGEPIPDSNTDNKQDNNNNTVLPEISKETVPHFVEADRQKAREAAKLEPTIDELSGDLLNDKAACEILCMQNKISADQLRDALKFFTQKLTVSGESQTKKNFRTYFNNWLPKNIDKIKKPSRNEPAFKTPNRSSTIKVYE